MCFHFKYKVYDNIIDFKFSTEYKYCLLSDNNENNIKILLKYRYIPILLSSNISKIEQIKEQIYSYGKQLYKIPKIKHKILINNQEKDIIVDGSYNNLLVMINDDLFGDLNLDENKSYMVDVLSYILSFDFINLLIITNNILLPKILGFDYLPIIKNNFNDNDFVKMYNLK